jgi:acyl-CoA synthetase (AMP-forming)/AMP-acid ligase II
MASRQDIATADRSGPTVNIAASVTRMAGDRPHAMAIACPAGRDRDGRVAYTHLTYRQLDDRSDRIARGLELAGIGRGVRTVLMVRPGLDLFCLVFGMLKAGAVPVLIDPGIGRRHLKRCIDNAAPEAFIGVPEAQLAARVLGWGRRTIRRRVTVGGRWPWLGRSLRDIEDSAGPAKAGEPVNTTADEVAAIVFTSGSTGPPKGVVYRHGNFVAQVEAIRDMFDLRPGEIDLPTFPLFALFDPALGMTTVVPDMDPTRPARVDPTRIIEPIGDFGVTMMFGSPALLDAVGRYGVEHGVRLPTLTRVLSAGAPVPPQVVERFASLLPDGARILTPYGASEALPVSVISSREILGETRHGTDRGAGVCVGFAVPSIRLELIEVTDGEVPSWDDTLVVPTGTVGEIVVKGAQVTDAYYNAERHDRAAKIRDPDGSIRHRMGDLGYLDDDGRLWFVGRKAHRVVTAAGPLDTIPCEGVFNTHPAVFRSGLVGVELDGETVPVLCVELERSARRADRSEIVRELEAIAAAHDHTREIRRFLFHPGFPVDIRHNAKIGREKLSRWAQKKVAR